MTQNIPDERLVYLALKNTFKGPDALIRKSKKIRELVQKVCNHREVKELIEGHSFESVCEAAKILLEKHIFESTLKAEAHFPEVFEVSPAQTAERSVSEAEAARSEANAIKSVGEDFPRPNHPRKRLPPDGTTNVPSLYPVYLPYQVQHQLLVKVQGILEKACYDFGLRELAEIIEHERWDCPQAIELNVWAKTFRENERVFERAGLEGSGKPFGELLDSLSHLRHTAVHRLRISSNRLEQFLIDAETLSQLLEDEQCSKWLIRFRREAQRAIGELRRNKDLLESKLNATLKRIADERATLDRLECQAIEDMLREDKEYQNLAGANLDEAIRSASATAQSATFTKIGSRSESDIENEISPTATEFRANDDDVSSARNKETEILARIMHMKIIPSGSLRHGQFGARQALDHISLIIIEHKRRTTEPLQLLQDASR